MEGLGPGAGDWGGKAMLAVRPRPAHRIGALGVLSFLVASALLGFLAAPVRGDAPIVSENSNASRTVSWTMGAATGLTLNGVDLEGANATLPWVPANVSWDTPAKFLARGSIGPNLVANATDISLRADTTNHVLDGDFASAAPWTYESSARGNVTAGWDGGTGTAVFRHASSATEASWDTMDGNLSSWIGLSGTGWTSRIGQHEGSGMLGLNFSLPPGPPGWAGVQRSSPVNWSAYDRMVLWIEPTGPSLPLSFNVTAYVGSNLYQTAPRDLVAGWQEISVDLGAFGPVRDSLVSLTLRVNGDNISGGQVFFDDLRVGNAKRFDEVAAIRQAVVKANATTPVAGSAVRVPPSELDLRGSPTGGRAGQDPERDGLDPWEHELGKLADVDRARPVRAGARRRVVRPGAGRSLHDERERLPESARIAPRGPPPVDDPGDDLRDVHTAAGACAGIPPLDSVACDEPNHDWHLDLVFDRQCDLSTTGRARSKLHGHPVEDPRMVRHAGDDRRLGRSEPFTH